MRHPIVHSPRLNRSPNLGMEESQFLLLLVREKWSYTEGTDWDGCYTSQPLPIWKGFVLLFAKQNKPAVSSQPASRALFRIRQTNKGKKNPLKNQYGHR